MTVEVVRTNLFTTRCQVIVNTINCEGVMGAGLALEFRLRYPAMFLRYAELCAEGRIRPGLLWIYQAVDRRILNFPTKDRWRAPSEISYLEQGLQKFADSYQERGITSIAFPLLGADKGGIAKDVSLGIMRRHLEPLPGLSVEIHEYDPSARDDLYEEIRATALGLSLNELAQRTGVSPRRLEVIRTAMASEDIRQVSQLGRIRGIGPDTLEKLFALRGAAPDQGRLDL